MTKITKKRCFLFVAKPDLHFSWLKSLIHTLSRCKEGENGAAAVSKVHHGDEQNKKVTGRTNIQNKERPTNSKFKFQIQIARNHTWGSAKDRTVKIRNLWAVASTFTVGQISPCEIDGDKTTGLAPVHKLIYPRYFTVYHMTRGSGHLLTISSDRQNAVGLQSGKLPRSTGRCFLLLLFVKGDEMAWCLEERCNGQYLVTFLATCVKITF